MYPGTINAHQGVDIAVKAFALAKDQLADAEFHIYGKGPELNNILNLIKDLNLEQVVFYKGWLSTDQILLKMASAFCAVVPKRSDDFGDEAFSTKIMEFMALGVPIIASNTRIDKYYFNDTLIQFFESGNEKDLSNKMSLIFQNPTVRQTAITNGLKFIEENNWDVKQQLYFDIVNSFQARTAAAGKP
jgi:glycosyltransferase involved in cell wall biosynthesis